MLFEIENSSRRLEQQITSFEKLHADELARFGEEFKQFQEQLATFQRLQNDELGMLRNQLQQLNDEIARLKADELPSEAAVASTPSAPVPAPTDQRETYATLSITRRDLLTGNILPKRP